MLKYFTILAIAFPAILSAQLTVNTDVTADYMAHTIVPRSDVSITNATYKGCNESKGTFTAINTNLGLLSGIILTSGNAVEAIGPNNSSSMGNVSQCGDNLYNNDGDLDSILALYPPLQPSYDVADLEFDFTSSTNTVITLTYVFGSEEYPFFANNAYSDLVAMFLSSPGQPKQNIALVPGTTLPVGVDWITPGDEYYVDNGDGSTPQGTIQFNGFTVPLTAQVNMEAGIVYHLKIAVADANDWGWDAGVFVGGIIPTPASTNELTAKTFNMYPNPANDFVVLSYNNVDKGVVQVFDAVGRVVYSSTLSNQQGNVQLETSNFASGLYSVRVLDNNVSVWNGKLVVE